MSNSRQSASTAPQLQQLIELSAEVIQTILNDQQISVEERTALALKVLALNPQAASSADAIAPDAANDHQSALLAAVSNGNQTTEAITETGAAPDTVEDAPPSTANADAGKQIASAEAAEAVLALLPEGWQQWIATNLERGCDRDRLVESMIKRDIDERLARQSIEIMAGRADEESQQLNWQQLQKLESLFTIRRQLNDLAPVAEPIERRDRISQQEFLERYYATNTPLILTDMLQDWPALSKWTPEHIRDTYGDVEVEVQANREANPNYEMEIAKHKQKMTLGVYADKVINSGPTNDFYMVANNGNLDRPEMKGLLDDIKILPEFFNPNDIQSRIFFWFGPAGTITPLHHDSMNIMMAHVYGRKCWRLINPLYTALIYNHIGVFSQIDLEAPDYEKFPLFKDVPVTEVVMEPGEILFIPVGWWHQVKGMDVTLSVSMTNFAFPNQFSFNNPDIRAVEQTQATQQATKTKTKTVSKAQLLQAAASPEVKAYQTGAQPLTNDVVDTTDACYLVDQIIPNAPLILAFGFVNWHSSPRFDFYGRTKKLEKLADRPLNRILVRDPFNAWYHRGVPGLGDTVDDIAIKFKGLISAIAPSRVITIGQSMGAYAAIMFGQLLGADQVLAFGPLSFLDAQKSAAIGDRRWLSVMQQLEANPPAVFYNDLALLGKAYSVDDIRIFYGLTPDPEVKSEVNLDDYHAKRLGELAGCKLYPYADSTHTVVKYLIDTQQIDSVLLDAIFQQSAIATGM